MYFSKHSYNISPKYFDRYISANSVDPDQTAPKEQSDLGLQCLPFRCCSPDISLVNQVDKYNKEFHAAMWLSSQCG